MSLKGLFSILKGGAGSGNKGHAGIPGHRGGSVAGGVAVTNTGPQNLDSQLENISIRSYDGGNHSGLTDYIWNASINHWLEDSSYKPEQANKFKKMMTSIDEDFKNISPTTTNIKVYRGLNKSDMDQIEKGGLTKKSYTSTSVSKERLKTGRYAGTAEIIIPKGKKVIYLGKFDFGASDSDKEILLPRNSSFKVISKKGNKVTLELE